MNDVIRRQEAIDAHCELCGDRGKCNCDICPDIEVFQLLPPAQQAAGDTISRQVTMDAQQEKTGYWFFSTTDFKTHCSACKQSEWYGYIPTPEEALKWMPICPKCGARMKESEIRTKKVRPAASVELDYGNDGRDCHYYVAYKCPTCGKSTNEGTVACDRCGTFFDWSKKASIKEIRKIEWE